MIVVAEACSLTHLRPPDENFLQACLGRVEYSSTDRKRMVQEYNLLEVEPKDSTCSNREHDPNQK